MLTEKEILARLKSAEHDRQQWNSRLQDYFFYALPFRTVNDSLNPNEIDELYDDTAVQAVQDFAADLLNNFTPQHVNWLKLRSAMRLGPADAAQVGRLFEDVTNTVFAEMKRSNLSEALQEAYSDLSTGTMGMVIEDRGADLPIHCECVPVSHLLIDRGPYGQVDGRFRIHNPRCGDLPNIWPDISWPKSIADRIRNSPNTRQKVIEGVIRDRGDRRNEEAWLYTVMATGKVLDRQEMTGSGSCPFLVARWLTDPVTAWGGGPLRGALANIKTLNKLQELILRRLDKVVDPVTFYDDDGTINLEHGVEAGQWIPRSPGSQIDIWESQQGFDASFFERDALQMQIKRALFQDKPSQRGKTPPTATQWLQESSELARRMGAPAGRLVTEWQFPIFQRFVYILGERGLIEPEIKINGQVVAAEPVSPLTMAQQQEDVVNADRLLEILQMRFGPEMAAMVANPLAFAEYMRSRLGVPTGLVRSEEEFQQLAQAAAQGMADGQAV